LRVAAVREAAAASGDTSTAEAGGLGGGACVLELGAEMPMAVSVKLLKPWVAAGVVAVMLASAA
jgi:hypothetical protein